MSIDACLEELTQDLVQLSGASKSLRGWPCTFPYTGGLRYPPNRIEGRGGYLRFANANAGAARSPLQSFARLHASISELWKRKGFPMQRLINLIGAASLVMLAAVPVYAQGAPQTVTLMKVDPQSLTTGYRTSKVVGSTIVNESNETVGTIDDLIVTPGGQAPYAVLSVGGLLGMGTKYVVVPFTALKIMDKKMVLPGGSKEALKALPDFKYNS